MQEAVIQELLERLAALGVDYQPAPDAAAEDDPGGRLYAKLSVLESAASVGAEDDAEQRRAAHQAELLEQQRALTPINAAAVRLALHLKLAVVCMPLWLHSTLPVYLCTCNNLIQLPSVGRAVLLCCA